MLVDDLHEVLARRGNLVDGSAHNDLLVVEVLAVDLDAQHVARIESEGRAFTHALDCGTLVSRMAEYAEQGARTTCVRNRVLSCVVARTVPVRELRQNLSQVLSDVADRREHVLVSRHGRPAAAIVPIDEYEALEETAEILSDPGAIAAIDAGLAELERDESVTLADLRGELAERRSVR